MSNLTRFFDTSAQVIIFLTDIGGAHLATRALGRAVKVLSATWAKKDTPLKQRL
jgi:hypothetical protein